MKTIRIEQNDLTRILTVNGVKISYDLLAAMTCSSEPGLWWRVERVGDVVTVQQRYDWSGALGA